MARGRFLSETIARDKRLNDMEIAAALVFMMAVPHLDRDGLIDGDPDVLWGRVCPRRRELLDAMPDVIAAWCDSGLVQSYETDDGPVLWFMGFAKNQVGLRYDREPASRFPAPPGTIRTHNGVVNQESQTASGNVPEDIRQPSGNVPEGVGLNDKYKFNDEVEVEVEVEDDDPLPSAGDDEQDHHHHHANLSEFVHSRLEKEWATPGKAQIDAHMKLAQRYGPEAWLRGFDGTKKAARANHSYVEKVIISSDPANHVNANQPNRTSRVDRSMAAVDAVFARLQEATP